MGSIMKLSADLSDLQLASSSHSSIDDRRLLTSRILIIYTGGTVGMLKCPVTKCYIPEPNYLKEKLKTFPQLYDMNYVYKESDMLTEHEPLATPISIYNRRIIYAIEEMNPLLDSSNMNMQDWTSIATYVEKHYKKFDGFVVLHGTDTMSYTAAALSFMLENLGKSVILTGSQIPISEQRNDAVDNILGALIMAAHYVIPEVGLYFNNQLFRGNRSIKCTSDNINAFSSPNMAPLGTVGTQITVNWHHMADADNSPLAKFNVQKLMCPNVGILRLFPGITSTTVNAFLAPPMQGVVLLSYGAGNAPDRRKDILDAFKEAIDRGVIIVNVTQCTTGFVSAHYNTGMVLMELGIIAGGDMVPEAALTKLCYVLSKPGLTQQARLQEMRKNLRGEMSSEVVNNTNPRLQHNSFLVKIAEAMHLSSEEELAQLRDAILPTIMCNSAALGKIEKLRQAVAQGGRVNVADYDGRSALHLAACEGQLEAVKYLLECGANVHTKDRFSTTPYLEAITNKHYEIVTLMKDTGAHLQLSDIQIAELISESILAGDPDQIDAWSIAQVNLNSINANGSTPLHLAVYLNHTACVAKLILHGADCDLKDSFGKSAKENAHDLPRPDCLALMSG